MDSRTIEEARNRFSLSALIRQSVTLRRASRGFIGLCPFHSEKTPSFHVDDARGTFKCFGCGAWGDCFDWVMQTKGLSFQDAVADLLGGSLSGPFFAPSCTRQSNKDAAVEDEKRRISHAHGIWLKRSPVEDTLSEAYLRRRCGTGPVPAVLGHVDEVWCAPLKMPRQALIAPLQDSAGHVTAIQQIFLDPITKDAYRGEDGRRIKRTLGAMRDGAVRLATPDTTLGIAGSVEDSLSASRLFSLPVWAVCGESRLATVWIPDDIDRLIIFSDADSAGEKFAKDAKRAHMRSWRTIEIMAPEGAKDWTQVIETREGVSG